MYLSIAGPPPLSLSRTLYTSIVLRLYAGGWMCVWFICVRIYVRSWLQSVGLESINTLLMYNAVVYFLVKGLMERICSCVAGYPAVHPLGLGYTSTLLQSTHPPVCQPSGFYLCMGVTDWNVCLDRAVRSKSTINQYQSRVPLIVGSFITNQPVQE